MNVPVPDGATALSPRQLQLLQLSANDMKQSAMAEHLALSIGHIANQFEKIHAKLGVHSTSAAIACAFRLGLLT